MPRKTLKPENLEFQPRPSYPYSPGAAGGGFIFTAGQVAWDETGEVTAIGDVAAQTRQTLKNVVSVLHGCKLILGGEKFSLFRHPKCLDYRSQFSAQDSGQGMGSKMNAMIGYAPLRKIVSPDFR